MTNTSYRPLQGERPPPSAARPNDDHAPLLGQTADDKLDVQGSAGLFSSISNLMNTILGTGAFAVASGCYEQVG